MLLCKVFGDELSWDHPWDQSICGPFVLVQKCNSSTPKKSPRDAKRNAKQFQNTPKRNKTKIHTKCPKQPGQRTEIRAPAILRVLPLGVRRRYNSRPSSTTWGWEAWQSLGCFVYQLVGAKGWYWQGFWKVYWKNRRGPFYFWRRNVWNQRKRNLCGAFLHVGSNVGLWNWRPSLASSSPKTPQKTLPKPSTKEICWLEYASVVLLLIDSLATNMNSQIISSLFDEVSSLFVHII